MRPSNLRNHSLRRLQKLAPPGTDIAEIANALAALVEDRAVAGDEAGTMRALDDALEVLGETLSCFDCGHPEAAHDEDGVCAKCRDELDEMPGGAQGANPEACPSMEAQ
jgi:rubrerythrin